MTIVPSNVAIASGPIVLAIQALYGIAKAINDFLDEHIEEMKKSENTTISRTGRVLEAAKYGFGIGYITSVVIIAAGQLLLGNPLAVAATVATAATLTNPVAMTCAAVGAIYYGWWALSDQERNEILEKLSIGLQIGIELIKSMLRFVIDKTKEMLSPKNIEEIKKFISSAAKAFGHTLGDVTHKLGDVVGDTFEAVKKKTGETMDKTLEIASNTYETAKDSAEKATERAREALGKIKLNHGKKTSNEFFEKGPYIPLEAPMNYWIFKCNPLKYNLDARLRDPEPLTTWLVTRYPDEIRKDDLAFIWQTGRKRGLRAVLHIETDPTEMPESPYEQTYLSVPDTDAKLRIIGKLTHRFQLIPGETLKAIQELQGMSVFHGYQQATNFRLTQEEGMRIIELIQEANPI